MRGEELRNMKCWQITRDHTLYNTRNHEHEGTQNRKDHSNFLVEMSFELDLEGRVGFDQQ